MKLEFHIFQLDVLSSHVRSLKEELQRKEINRGSNI